MGAEAAIFSWHFCLEICQESQNPVYPNGKEIKLVWKRSTDMTERLTVKHMVLGGVFPGFRNDPPLFYRPDPSGGQYAASHAHPGSSLQLCMRMAVGIAGGFGGSSASQRCMGDAAYDACGCCHGL